MSIISRISRSLATCVRFSQSSSGTRDDDGVSFKEGVVATWERVDEVVGSDGENTVLLRLFVELSAQLGSKHVIMCFAIEMFNHTDNGPEQFAG